MIEFLNALRLQLTAKLTRRARQWAFKERGRLKQHTPSSAFKPPVETLGDPKIFGIGLSKTGTTSLFKALHELGYRAATFRHMKALGLDEWLQGDFRNDYLYGFDAVTDLPIGTMYRELDERYPGSKFVLTVRPIEPWLSSIRHQFTAHPDTGRFNILTRVMAYGYTVFNEGAFRRAYMAHERDVRQFFADRPGDLLILDLFSGQGWEELCGFLGRQPPNKPFPSVNPRNVMRSVSTEANRIRVPSSSVENSLPVAVIPLIDPNHRNVTDYRGIEVLLKRTCMSILQQVDSDVRIVVVGTRVPYWLEMQEERIIFVDASLCQLLDGRLRVQIDKGVKTILGYLVARALFDVSLIYTVDADDFLHVELFSTLRRLSHEQQNNDGILWTRGLNVGLVRLNDGTLVPETAYAITNFHRACGTCRAIRGERLLKKLKSELPFLGDLEQGVMQAVDKSSLPVARVSHDLAKFVSAQFRGDYVNDEGFVHAIGRHVRQETHFSFESVSLFGAAKSCGHGQHDGPRRGAIHSDKILCEVPRMAFLESFGLVPLSGRHMIDINWDPSSDHGQRSFETSLGSDAVKA